MKLSSSDPLAARAIASVVPPKRQRQGTQPGRGEANDTSPLPPHRVEMMALYPVRVVLPYPPSVNRLYRVGRNGRPYKTELHRDYMAAAGASVGVVMPWPKSQALDVTLRLYRPQKRGDIDNPLKALFDALNGRAWCDDSQVEHLEATRLDDAKNPRVEIWLRQWKP